MSFVKGKGDCYLTPKTNLLNNFEYKMNGELTYMGSEPVEICINPFNNGKSVKVAEGDIVKIDTDNKKIYVNGIESGEYR